MLLNNFNCVPTANQVVTIYTCGFDNVVTFNMGSSSFGVAGVNCPDLYVWGNGSTVTFNDYKFVNGSRDNPVIQFAPGVTTSKVIVNFGSNTKTYTSDGTGVTLAAARIDSGTFANVLTFGDVPATLSGGGSWHKSDGINIVNGRLTVTAKGAGTGVARVSGWPVFAPRGDAALNLMLVTGIVGGPIAGFVDNSNSAIGVLKLRTATGDFDATAANFTVGTTIWYEFTYPTA